MTNSSPIANERDALVAVARMIERREDPSTGHIDRIGAYSLRIASGVIACCDTDLASRVTETFLADIEDAAALHDIGKACIPDNILLKPGHLSAEEFEVIRSHTTHGAKAFESLPRTPFGQLAYEVIRFHHEKWDGTGYPDGLEGEDIPLAARIVALADCYDALTTWRCYKTATTHNHACEIIEQAAHTHFDPRLTQVFLAVASDIAECSN